MKLTLLSVTALALLTASVSAAEAPDPATVATYNKLCAACHGKDGAGKTTMGRKVGAKDYTDPKVVAEMKDDQAIKQIKEGMKDPKTGKELMKPFEGKVSDAEIKALLKYMKSFAKK